MTAILFVCCGNTCRSPLAECFAKRVFSGPNHRILSVGLETADGGYAAAKALAVAKEFDLDLSTFRTRSINSVDLQELDMVVSLDSGIGAALEGYRLARHITLDVEDPYGKSLDEYRDAARLIQVEVRRIYALDALHRLKSPNPPLGSHAKGIVDTASREFEKTSKDIVPLLTGEAVRKKRTLGQVASDLERGLPGVPAASQPTARTLVATIRRINQTWVSLKHLDDPPPGELIATTQLIVDGFCLAASLYRRTAPVEERIASPE